MRFISAFATTVVLVLLAASCSQAALLQRRQREVPATELSDDNPTDQVSVAVIEVQEPDTVVQSLQVETAIQSADNNAADNEQELEMATGLADASTLASKLDAETEIYEFKKIEEVQKILTELPATADQEKPVVEPIVPDLAVEATETKATEITALPDDNAPELATIVNVEPGLRQATQATPTQSTTPQNFVQFIQSSPIGQFFSQLTGGQQQQQQPGAAAQNGANPTDSSVAATTPTVPVFLNPGAALTQAQQAVQNAAQSVVNTTTQAFQGLQQFASNIGNQFQNTLSSLSGQNQQQGTADATSARPPGPIQSVINNLVGNTGATTAAPAQNTPQGPFQGIISFFQGGQRPQNAPNNAQLPNAVNNNNNNNKPSNANNLDDKIGNEIANDVEINNEVRNSEEILDSFEETQNGQQLIIVNDDATLRTEQTTTV